MPDGRPWPRVSIVVPSYNQSAYIEETLRSILLQGYPNLEAIVVDGGSTDGSVEIIRRYERWLGFWVSEPDRGQTHAINKGWARATGDILAYINTDDYYAPGAVAVAAAAFHENPGAGMVYGSAIVVDESGSKLRVWQAQAFDLGLMLTGGNIVPQPAAFFAAEALRSIGYVDERWQMIMDYELCIRLGLGFPAVCLPRSLAWFRDHAQSKTRTRFENTAGELIRFLSAFAPNQVAPHELRSLKRSTLSRIYYEWSLAYLARGRQHAGKALRQFLESLLRDPRFALRRPLDSAYIVKEVLVSWLAAALMARNARGLGE
jgi:glycosyltransferase involved in cell wall biosynthesis